MAQWLYPWSRSIPGVWLLGNADQRCPMGHEAWGGLHIRVVYFNHTIFSYVIITETMWHCWMLSFTCTSHEYGRKHSQLYLITQPALSILYAMI